MKILVLGGSPNKNGSTQILIDSFTRGAGEAGHAVTVLNVAHMKVQPCTGCIACGYDGPCVQKDDMAQIRKAVMESLLKDWKVSPNCMTVSGKGDFSDADPEKLEGEIRLAIKQEKVPECDIITVLSQLLTEKTAYTAYLTQEGCQSTATLR